MKIANEVGNVQLMQRINRLKVLEVIRRKGPLARPEIAKLTGLSPSSITNIITYLLERCLVAEMGTVDSKDVGRKATLLRFNPSNHRIIAVDMEATRIDFALTDLAGEIISMHQTLPDKPLDENELLDLVKKEIARLTVENSGQGGDIVGIGIAISALVKDEGRFVLSTSLRWKGLSIREQLEKEFNLPVFILNNSRTKALWALNLNVEESDRNVIFLDLSIGVGIVSFFDHKINEAVIGEFGHTTVDKDGPLCFCGNRGCLELMCSVEAVVNKCKDQMGQGKCTILAKLLQESKSVLSFDAVLQAFAQGDGEVGAVLQECGKYLGMGIANIIYIFNPQRIIINGDPLLKSDYIYETAVAEANTRANDQLLQGLKYQKITIGIPESIQGVSSYVADKLFELSNSIL
jgi:N-acetylglucosamine repressor